MTVGQRIKKLRTSKNLTQKDLAEEVHVTFQTVSKWEKDENEPDLITLKTIAKLFGVTLDYFVNDDDEVEKEEKVEDVPALSEQPESAITKTIIIHQNELHVCAKCGKDIPEEELVSEDIEKRVRHGRATRNVSIGQTYYHKACLDKIRKERADALARKAIRETAAAKKKCFGWGIAGGALAFVIFFLIYFFATPNGETANIGLTILFSTIASYAIFSMIYCILSGSYIGDVFVWCAGLSIKFPGLIFTWDLDGFLWLIGMKILFAVLGFLVGVLALLFAILFSGLLGMFSFPFVLIHNNNNGYADAF